MTAREIRCELTWSASRAKLFDTCRRQYYFQYYASFRGWDPKAPRAARIAYRLKQMTSLPQLVGNVVHDTIQAWLEARLRGAQLPQEKAMQRARAALDRAWRESRGRGWLERPKRIARLTEHHYGDGITPERAAELLRKVERALQGFFEHASLAPLRTSWPGHWLSVEGRDRFEVDDVPVFAVPDFALRRGDEVLVLDWKTGRPREDDRRQMLVYALYARERWNVDPASLSLWLVYLPTGRIDTVPVTPRAVDDAADDIRHSLDLMRPHHFDPDRENVPQHAFPANGVPRACPSCRFREICDAISRSSSRVLE